MLTIVFGLLGFFAGISLTMVVQKLVEKLSYGSVAKEDFTKLETLVTSLFHHTAATTTTTVAAAPTPAVAPTVTPAAATTAKAVTSSKA